MPDPVIPAVVDPAVPPAAPAPADPVVPPAGDPPADDSAKLQSALVKERELRKTADKEAKAGKDAIARLAELETANQTELEKAQSERDAALEAVSKSTTTIRNANLKVGLASSKYGLADAKATATLIADRITYDDDTNEPTNLDEAVKEIIDELPFLVGNAPKPKAPVTNASAGGASEQTVELTAEEVSAAKSFGMTNEEYAAYKSTTPPEPSAT